MATLLLNFSHRLTQIGHRDYWPQMNADASQMDHDGGKWGGAEIYGSEQWTVDSGQCSVGWLRPPRGYCSLSTVICQLLQVGEPRPGGADQGRHVPLRR